MELFFFFFSEETRRRTKTIQNTLSPKWNQTFTFGPIKRAEFRGRDLDVTVWDFEQYGAKEFLGQVSIIYFYERIE